MQEKSPGSASRNSFLKFVAAATEQQQQQREKRFFSILLIHPD